jgi:hypothetical protein
MPGIVITAIGVAVVATLFYGGVLLWRAPREERPLLVLCYLLQLPMSAAAFYLVRVPLQRYALDPLLGGNEIYWWARGLLSAPLTEEPAKLWPLLLPWIATRVTRENATRVAMALGVGFGVGEAGLIASFVLGSAEHAARPWYEFGGFLSERFLVCLIHGLFTAMVLLGWKRWRIGFAGGLALGMLLHLLANMPILLGARGLLGSNPIVGAIIVQLWVIAFWIAAWVVLLIRDSRLAAGLPWPGQPVACPKCGETFERGLLAPNLVWKRLERCPHCRRWSVV